MPLSGRAGIRTRFSGGQPIAKPLLAWRFPGISVVLYTQAFPQASRVIGSSLPLPATPVGVSERVHAKGGSIVKEIQILVLRGVFEQIEPMAGTIVSFEGRTAELKSHTDLGSWSTSVIEVGS